MYILFQHCFETFIFRKLNLTVISNSVNLFKNIFFYIFNNILLNIYKKKIISNILFLTIVCKPLPLPCDHKKVHGFQVDPLYEICVKLINDIGCISISSFYVVNQYIMYTNSGKILVRTVVNLPRCTTLLLVFLLFLFLLLLFKRTL